MAKFTDALKFWSKPLTRGVRAITGNLDEQEEGQLRQEQERLFQSILNTTQPFRMGANTFAQNYGPAFRALTGGDPLTPGPVEQFTREALTPEEQDYLERKPYMAALKSSAGMASTLAPFASQGLRTAQLAANPLANRIAQLASQGALEGSLGGFGYSRGGREVQDTLTGGLVGAGGELFMDYLTNPQFRKMLTDATTTVNPQTGARMYKGELGFNEDVLDTLNPTGGLTADYTPDTRVKARLGENITTLDKTMGRSADEMITVYRGASNSQGKISPGDFITTNEQLARDYAGTGRVIKERVRLGDILDDLTEPLGEEYIYRPMTGISTQATLGADDIPKFEYGVEPGNVIDMIGKDPAKKLELEAMRYGSPEEFVANARYNTDIKNTNLDFREELVGNYSGQSDIELGVYGEDGKIKGLLEYSDYGNTPYIKHIEVLPGERGKGIGKDLIKKLQSDYPDSKIEWGMLTDEGAKLKESLDKELINLWKKAHSGTDSLRGGFKEILKKSGLK